MPQVIRQITENTNLGLALDNRLPRVHAFLMHTYNADQKSMNTDFGGKKKER
jgi:hypothetical protein